MQLFLDQHAIVHSAEVGTAGDWSLGDTVLKNLTDEQLRLCPKGMNSIAWLFWHMARTEDVTVNLLLAGRSQVFSEGAWAARMNLAVHDIGTGMSDDEVAGFSERVDIPALRAYRNAVGQRTREVVQSLRLEELDQMLDSSDVQRLFDEGALDARARRLAAFWADHPKRFILLMPATGHNFMHLSEAVTVRKHLGL